MKQIAVIPYVMLMGLVSSIVAADEAPESYCPPAACVSDASAWRTPPIRPQGFQFEIRVCSLGACYEPERVRASITGHNLGEYVSAVAPTTAAEWGYSFVHLDGQTDGAGRRIAAGYPTPPASRSEALAVIEAFLHRQYIRGADHPWSSLNGHYPWHHYAAEFGFDQLGSEIGENINNYQWHIALNRGAARQYRRPWFIVFSAWHGPGITDYSNSKIWGAYSHPDNGHSMNLFERALFMSYMAGAGQITAEAGGALAFLPEPGEDGLYPLSPYGEVCRKLREFSLAWPDVGIPCTPFGIVLDFYHGAYPGFGDRKAFGHFAYTEGDQMTWALIDMVWPGGWEVMGRNETGVLVNGPYGDIFDVLLQNASQETLDSYPCLILSGDIHLSDEERARYTRYVERGGTLILNTAYRDQFSDFREGDESVARATLNRGKGRVILYGPDYDVSALDHILREEMAAHVPVRVDGDIQYMVNVRKDRVFVTLINNAGITKTHHEPPVADPTETRNATVWWKGPDMPVAVRDIKNHRDYDMTHDSAIAVKLPPGKIVILTLGL